MQRIIRVVAEGALHAPYGLFDSGSENFAKNSQMISEALMSRDAENTILAAPSHDVVQLCKEFALAVKTAKVTGRRQLHFSSVDEILAEAERLASGPHRTLGNWSLGQILWHLAKVMNSSINGTPVRPNFFMRLLGAMMKRGMLSKPMPAGFQLPASFAKIFGPPETSVADGLRIFREAVGRQKSETHREPSPFLSKMTDDDYVQLHCHHAELHLSFLLPEN